MNKNWYRQLYFGNAKMQLLRTGNVTKTIVSKNFYGYERMKSHESTS